MRPLIGVAEDGAADDEARRLPPGGGFPKGSPRSAPAFSCSRTCTGQTMAARFRRRLVDRAHGLPLLVVAPHGRSSSPAATWGGGKPNAPTLSLSPLGADDAGRLVDSLLPAATDDDVRSTVVARAAGNPLYAEQFARAIGEHRRLDELPDSVQRIIAARLDGLTVEEKRLLQDASVMGDVFWLGALEAISGRSAWEAEELLHALERKEFVHRVDLAIVGDRAAYVFRHGLLREVAYRQIPRADRAAKHRSVAGWLDANGRPEDRAELIAHSRHGTGVGAAGRAGHDRLRHAGARSSPRGWRPRRRAPCHRGRPSLVRSGIGPVAGGRPGSGEPALPPCGACRPVDADRRRGAADGGGTSARGGGGSAGGG